MSQKLWGCEADMKFEAGYSRRANGRSTRACFRLIKSSSLILRKTCKVAVLDAYDEVQIGRDWPNSMSIPKIRLKEMEVSKLHATLFWDTDRRCWAIVDMGSKHGTFVYSGVHADEISDVYSFSSSVSDPQRLSPSRVASMPHVLRHLDTILIGSTVFLVHIHPEGSPCPECSWEDNSQITLFHDSNEYNSTSNYRQGQTIKPDDFQNASYHESDSRISLHVLKKNLLSSGKYLDKNLSASNAYVDRSAKRRALCPPSAVEAPGVSAPNSPLVAYEKPDINTQHSLSLQSSSSTNSATPIPDSNIGHKLLLKQGWEPGLALGKRDSREEDTFTSTPEGLVEPIELIANQGRTGIGAKLVSNSMMSATSFHDGNWREESRRRRWDELKLVTT